METNNLPQETKSCTFTNILNHLQYVLKGRAVDGFKFPHHFLRTCNSIPSCIDDFEK